MCERRDDTPEQDEPSPKDRGPGKYYYDDSTGYEIYDPARDEEDEEDEDEDTKTAVGAGDKSPAPTAIHLTVLYRNAL